MDSANGNEEIVSSEFFRILMLKLCNEKNNEKRNLLSMNLSKALLQQNGFHAYLKYLSFLTDDSIELLNAFCKVIFSRPSIFLSDIDYLKTARINFVGIVELFLEFDDEQYLRIFLTKLFYFLRRTQSEDQFYFLFEEWNTNSSGIDFKIFQKLCDWKFYFEELSVLYYKLLKCFIFKYLSIKTFPILNSIHNGASILKYKMLCKLFDEIGILNVEACFFDSNHEEINQNILEAALMVSFPNLLVLNRFKNKVHELTFSDEFMINIQKKINESEFVEDLWLKITFLKQALLNVSYLCSSVKDNENISLIEITEDNAPDVAYYLYNIRIEAENSFNENFGTSLKLLNWIISCLFHTDSFVYMNSIKTCIVMGRKSPKSTCDALINAAEIINIENSEKIPAILNFIQIFDNLLSHSGNSSVMTCWTQKFVICCLKFLNITEKKYKLKCLIIKYFINILKYDQSVFLTYQESIWNAFKLPYMIFVGCDLEAQTIFLLIESYLKKASEVGRHMIHDAVICQLHQFLTDSLSSGDYIISSMSCNNLVVLNGLKNF